MNRFQLCLPMVLQFEGGFSNDPDDPGGATYKGITLKTYREWRTEHDQLEPTVDDLKAISDETVAQIYASKYWMRAGGDQLPAGIDRAVFDFAVNSGPLRAVSFLQVLVGVEADGYPGPLTTGAVLANNAERLIRELNTCRLKFLRDLETWSKYKVGWTRRVMAVERLSLEDAKLAVPPAPAPAPPIDHPLIVALRAFILAETRGYRIHE